MNGVWWFFLLMIYIAVFMLKRKKKKKFAMTKQEIRKCLQLRFVIGRSSPIRFRVIVTVVKQYLVYWFKWSS